LPKKSVSGEIDGYALHTEKFHETQTVALVLTSACNLRCKYCYEKHDLRDRRSMPFTMIKEILSRHLNASNDYKRVIVDFFGGEPLLEFPLIKQTIEWVKSCKWQKEYSFQIGTNGTILNDEIKSFLLKNRKNIELSFSLDGNRTAHNISRDNSYDLLAPNIPFFIENWPNNPAKMTICAETIPYLADSIIEIEEKGYFFTANVVFEDIWGDEQKKTQLLGEYERQLEQLVDYYVQHRDLFLPEPIFRPFPSHLRNEESRENAIKAFKQKQFCGSGLEMIAYDIDGKAYPCHRFIPLTTGKEWPGEIKMNKTPNWETEKCQPCDLLPVCPSCVGFNWEINKNPYQRTTFHCDALALEVIARCKYESRILPPIDQVEKLSDLEQAKLKEKSEVLDFLNKNGFYVPK
jgi:radical SAM protein with 4Fe4S-binding SPASM domain